MPTEKGTAEISMGVRTVEEECDCDNEQRYGSDCYLYSRDDSFREDREGAKLPIRMGFNVRVSQLSSTIIIAKNPKISC